MNSEHTYFSDEPGNFSDEEAWNRFKQGDKKAFEHIFKKYNPVLYHFGIKFFYDKDIVEDCIQELFLKLWKNREKLAEVSTVKYYLITSLRRLLLRDLIILKRQSDINNIMGTAEFNNQHTSSHESHIIAQQLLKEKTDKLTLAIDQLPPRQKEAVYLKFYEEKTYEEITSIMSINYQTARKFIYKALQTIRKNLNTGTDEKQN